MDGQQCCLGCKNPVYREYTLKCEGYETLRDKPLCEDHARAIVTHDPKAYNAIEADRYKAAEYRYMVENDRSRLLNPRNPNPDRARKSNDQGQHLRMQTPSPPDPRGSTLGGASTNKDQGMGWGFLSVEVATALGMGIKLHHVIHLASLGILEAQGPALA